jgi:hypothetical protein
MKYICHVSWYGAYKKGGDPYNLKQYEYVLRKNTTGNLEVTKISTSKVSALGFTHTQLSGRNFMVIEKVPLHSVINEN